MYEIIQAIWPDFVKPNEKVLNVRPDYSLVYIGELLTRLRGLPGKVIFADYSIDYPAIKEMLNSLTGETATIFFDTSHLNNVTWQELKYRLRRQNPSKFVTHNLGLDDWIPGDVAYLIDPGTTRSMFELHLGEVLKNGGTGIQRYQGYLISFRKFGFVDLVKGT